MKYSENDVVRAKKAVIAEVIGERRKIEIPSQAEGVIVMVYGNPDQPEAYEIEYYVAAQNCYALATLAASEIQAQL